MEGVTFGLFDAETTEFTEETAIEVTSTNEAGEFVFEAPYGSFQVMELATLPGYLTMEEPVAVEVNTAEVELGTHRQQSDDSPHFQGGCRDWRRIARGYLWNCTVPTAP